MRKTKKITLNWFWEAENKELKNGYQIYKICEINEKGDEKKKKNGECMPRNSCYR